jgi:DNA repair exonuclease SbcCD ATPase subunit
MSVMWGLTGSMDTRLVADGLAIDVAYDTGSSADNRTAEVVVSGTINAVPFTVTRRRGKKSALIFTLNDEDQTKQSVKDTQIAIDQALGIGNSLLQRCCFFGQHSHAMTSLLGLSDRSWKNELGACSLVDLKLWNAAWTEVRAQGRQLKANISEMAVETRVRNEEYSRTMATLQQNLALLKQAESDLSSASASMNSSSNGTMDASSLKQVQAELEDASRELQRLQSLIMPLREGVLLNAKQKASMVSEHDRRIASTREQFVRSRSDLSAASTNTASLQEKLVNLRPQYNHQLTTLKHMISSLGDKEASVNLPYSAVVGADDFPSIVLTEDVVSTAIPIDAFNRVLEVMVSAQAATEVRIKATSTSLQRLAEHQAHHQQPTTTDVEEESCPTCGQSLSLDLQQQRENELRQTLRALESESQSSRQRIDLARKKLSLCHRIRSSQEQLQALTQRIREIQVELQAVQPFIKTKQDELAQLEQSVADAVSAKAASMKEWDSKDESMASKLQAQELKYRQLQDKEKQLRSQLERLRVREHENSLSRNRQESSLQLLRDRAASINRTVSDQKRIFDDLEKQLQKTEKLRLEFIHRTSILERLDDVFGPRGIQHFVFMQTIQQLENIANLYLLILAEGGIQLTLQSSDTDDKIMKSVFIRSAADGEYRERALSQLSGGQWRRVSLSLDFAFTELIRRRGILRCNVMVLDEILTYLDAAGREAVGTVLRAMASSSSSRQRDTSLIPVESKIIYNEEGPATSSSTSVNSAAQPGGDISHLLLGNGSYETVIVILQDLVAMELEESFDHVDVVVKSGDVSTVILDGDT